MGKLASTCLQFLLRKKQMFIEILLTNELSFFVLYETTNLFRIACQKSEALKP